MEAVVTCLIVLLILILDDILELVFEKKKTWKRYITHIVASFLIIWVVLCAFRFLPLLPRAKNKRRKKPRHRSLKP